MSIEIKDNLKVAQALALLEYAFEYECLKSSAHILLSSSNFNQNNEKWTVDWESIKNKIK